MINECPKTKLVPLTSDQYYQDAPKKTQIVLHHTAGNSSGVATINGWEKDARGRIATCVTISGKGKTTIDGEICQAYSSRYWAYHLGIKPEVFKARGLPYLYLDKHSIGIEICNWGGLDKVGDKYYNYVDREVLPEDVCILDEPYKGHKFYHKYTDAQIESVRQLLLYWGELYGISLKYDYTRLFTVNNEALTMVNGLYTHNSYRKDKSDISPQPDLIAMLKSL
jgi:hypothetical protein